MTKIAIIGAGPCGLSMLRAFEQAEKNGEKTLGKTTLIPLTMLQSYQEKPQLKKYQPPPARP